MILGSLELKEGDRFDWHLPQYGNGLDGEYRVDDPSHPYYNHIVVLKGGRVIRAFQIQEASLCSNPSGSKGGRIW